MEVKLSYNAISFGEYLVLRRRITPRAVLSVLKKQTRSRPHLGELAVRKGWTNWAEVLGTLSLAERRRVRFGQAAIERGLLSEEQVQFLIREQQSATPSLADCILDLGLMEPEDLEHEKAGFESQQCVEPLEGSGG